MTVLDQDAIVACAEIVGRSGASKFEHGYLHDGVPVEQAGWYAIATYRGGTRIIVENMPGPSEAADGLARKLLNGAKCTNCGKVVSLSDRIQPVGDVTLSTGEFWPAQARATAGQCRWSRQGDRWEGECRR